MFNDKHRSPEDTLSREIANASEWNSSQVYLPQAKRAPPNLSTAHSWNALTRTDTA